MKTFNCLFLILFLTSLLQAQKVQEIFYHTIEISKAIGDLNHDNLEDSVMVIQDTIAENQAYKLQIYFAQRNGNYTLYLETGNPLLPNYPQEKNEYNNNPQFSQIYIHEGNLYVRHKQPRSHFEHYFRFQNEAFFLVGFNKEVNDSLGILTKSYFNLLKGEFIVQKERFSTGEIIHSEKEYRLINPLPKLQDFKPLSKEFF
ncbi:MAG: hypothetical protein JXQ69_08740 [Paludibacteraceae bacterium]|nr:hypothetical protein [Paludibacteraceae bacterium]MBN2788390.1 hypothetical protein [Paludibacteraceae bacterium]